MSNEQSNDSASEETKCEKNNDIGEIKINQKADRKRLEFGIEKLRTFVRDVNLIVLDNFFKFCHNTSAHGFFNVARAGHFLIKLIWLSLILTCMSICFSNMARYLGAYFKYSTNTKYHTIVESPTEFPAVTVCNLNPFDLARNNATGVCFKKILEDQNMNQIISADNDSNKKPLESVKDVLTILKASVLTDKYLPMNNPQDLSFSIETLLISCYFNGVECFPHNFTRIYTHEYGNCYTFNANYHPDKQPLKTNLVGPNSGLILEIFVGSPGKEDYYSIKHGAYVIVHEPARKPLIKLEGLTVQTGTATNIGVKRTYYSKKEYPYSNCRKNIQHPSPSDSTFFKVTSNFTKYTQKLCIEYCFQNLFIKTICNCSDPSVPILNLDETICYEAQTLDCVRKERNKFNTKIIESACSKYCPEECDSVFYSTTLSTSSYPTEYYSNILKEQPSIKEKLNVTSQYQPERNYRNFKSKRGNRTRKYYENETISNFEDIQLKNAILMVSVFLEEMRYTLIVEDEAVNFETLLGVIGGQFGFFLGASFLSFAEFFQMLFNLVFDLVKFRKKQSKS